jgi:hypothetical protein
MTSRQNAKLNMYQTVLDICSDNQIVYASVIAFVNGVAELRTTVDVIRTTEEQQENTCVPGVTQEKQDVVNRLIERTMQIANAIYAYAFSTGKIELQNQSRLTKSRLHHMEGNVLLSTAKIVSKNEQDHAVELVAYGVTAILAEELDDLIIEFENAITKPRDTTVERKVYTDNLPKLFAAANTILYDKLDKLITLFQTSDPDFYDAYKTARNFIYTGIRHRKPA